MKAESIDQIETPMMRALRQRIELRGNDLEALAAMYKGVLKDRKQNSNSPDQIKTSLKKIDTPVMTVVGSNELIPGDKTLIAQLIPNACHFQIQGKDHLTVVPDPKFKMVVKAFLDYVNKT
ncbi:MAG: alpha/beta fold hydrolase [Promethearchaeota archaeon]